MPTAGPSACVLILASSASERDRAALLAAAAALQPGTSVAEGDGWAAVAVGDGVPEEDLARLRAAPAVARVVEVDAPYRLATREIFEGDAEVRLGPEAACRIGGGAPLVLAASCPGAEGDQTRLTSFVSRASASGIALVHAGRPAAGPGSGEQNPDAMAIVEAVASATHHHGLAISVEVDDAQHIEWAAEVADLLQVGAGNMQDFSLLRELGRSGTPVLLRRGAGATVEEFLLAAEYVLSNGNGRVILCESGIRTFDSGRRPRFEINAIPLLKMSTHLPVVADPSASVTHPALVPPVARAAVAAGADGLFLEVRDRPSANGKVSDETALDPSSLEKMLAQLAPIAAMMGRGR
jgi:3-deoxy-7-phosphoheptulonate synthase